VRATAVANLFESEVEWPEATAETATESPEDRGAAIEGVGRKSSDRLWNVGRLTGILRELKNERPANTCESGNNVRRQQNASNYSEKIG